MEVPDAAGRWAHSASFAMLVSNPTTGGGLYEREQALRPFAREIPWHWQLD